MKGSKMIYGMEMNVHQVDQYTIQAYILHAEYGTSHNAPVTFESPAKHPKRTKTCGEPYAREHASMFNILKAQLIHEGKWKTVCSGCGWLETEKQQPIIEENTKYCPVCDTVLE